VIKEYPSRALPKKTVLDITDRRRINQRASETIGNVMELIQPPSQSNEKIMREEYSL